MRWLFKISKILILYIFILRLMGFSMALKRIIDGFGGQERLASLLGVAQGTISYWIKTARVPAKWHKNLIALAEQEGISIQAHELSRVWFDDVFKDVPDMPENIISDGSVKYYVKVYQRAVGITHKSVPPMGFANLWNLSGEIFGCYVWNHHKNKTFTL